MKRKIEIDLSQDLDMDAVYVAEVVSAESVLYNETTRNQFFNPMTGQTIGNVQLPNPIGAPTAFYNNTPSISAYQQQLLTPRSFLFDAHNRNNVSGYNYHPHLALPANAYPPPIPQSILATELIMTSGNVHLQPTKINAPTPEQGLEREAISLFQAIKRINSKKFELRAKNYRKMSYINELFDKDFTLPDLKNCINNLDDLARLVKYI